MREYKIENVIRTRMTSKILSCLLLALLLSSCGGGSSTTGSGTGINPVGFSVLLGATFANPRCQNCHAFETEDPVGIQHRQTGRADRDCAECHFTPGWRAPFQSFSFANLSSIEICEGVKARSGNDVQELRASLLESTLARWALEDGGVPVVDASENLTGSVPLPTAPPNSVSALAALVDQWIAGGASCD